MVLAQLDGSISRAIQQMSNATIIDDNVLNECLNEITRALLQSDVQLKLVSDMQTNIKRIVSLHDLTGGHNKRRIIQQAIFTELCQILDPRKSSFTPKKGKASVIMFVGLQGSGKTTACTKYAYYHLKKGWKPALVSSRAGAFDQLKQNDATRVKIPFYGRIAVEGVKRFKKENYDLIIVDTGGHHKQEASLFEEMHQVAEATRPDLVIFVMDSSIGQAAFDQAQAFKQSVSVGAVIITKMDGHAKGVGALSAVAATKSPVIFIGTGEHIDEFEVFDVKPFVSRLLDILMSFVQLPQKLFEGNLTLRMMYEKFQKILKRDSIGQVLSMLPPKSAELTLNDHEKEIQAKFKSYVTVMDSMTDEGKQKMLYIWFYFLNSAREITIESNSFFFPRASGRRVREVMGMLELYKDIAKVRSKLGEMGGIGALPRSMMMKQIGRICGVPGA
ncbi:hypothetical protein EZV62_022874 [Acer yangbiense]|uniref:signal-recognition-particle GTPase n=1 Tax=Acer yangbiense TaxID=1000413 RepID=A0A5C7GZZ0_9ROSI|nr:hypothetical protein EZV62_022874 [Acer yangbiense]